MRIEPIINKVSGFTLIEIIITMVLASIIAGTVTIFIDRPILAYTKIAYRAELVDVADQALRRLARDIQRSVPNSLRVSTSGSTSALEMVNSVEGARYRELSSGTLNQPVIDFTKADSTFDVITPFQFALSNSTCVAGNCRIVIYNTGATTNGSSNNPSPGANVYSLLPAPACSIPGTSSCLPPPGSYTITPVGTTVTLANSGPGGEGNITLNPTVQFAFGSPRHRLYVVDTPVSFVCSPSVSGGNITRYTGYAINPTQPVSAPSGSTSALLAQNVTACSFTYTPGTTQRNGIVTMALSLTKNNETVTLMRQVSVSNAP